MERNNVEQEMATTHGQFHLSSELVAALHRDSGRTFPGFRPVHALGRIPHDVEAVTGRPATSVRDYIANHAELFGVGHERTTRHVTETVR
jgi:hypothetical protein